MHLYMGIATLCSFLCILYTGRAALCSFICIFTRVSRPCAHFYAFLHRCGSLALIYMRFYMGMAALCSFLFILTWVWQPCAHLYTRITYMYIYTVYTLLSLKVHPERDLILKRTTCSATYFQRDLLSARMEARLRARIYF